MGTRDESFGVFVGTSWRDVFDSLSASEQTCIRGQLGVLRLSSVLGLPLLNLITPPAEWTVDFFRCLEHEAALRLLIFWLGEGWYDITENSLSCARESLADVEVADYFAGILPDASSESSDVSRQIRRDLLACNVKPIRDSLLHSGPGITKTEQLCLRSRFDEDLVAWLVERESEAGSDPWQAQVYRCLGDANVARLLFKVLPTEAGGVFRDQESCVRNRLTDAEIAGGLLPATHPDRAAAIQALIDVLRSCIPDLILSGDDAHPVDRRLSLFTSADSSCVNVEIGETFLNLALGKPFRPNPDIVLTMQGCFVKPTAAAISLAVLSRELDGITAEHEACVRSHLADAEFSAVLLPAARPSGTPEFQAFSAGYRACIADLLASVDDGTGSARFAASPLWRFSTGGPVVAAPAVGDGVVFAGSDDMHVYALDAATGEMRWSFATGDAVRSSPTVSEGVVFVGSNDNHLYALDAGSGDLLWKIDTGNWVQYRPTVSDGVVYLSVQDADAHELHAVDAKSGERIWASEVSIAFSPETAPAAVGSQVYVTSAAGDLVALSTSTGDVLWAFSPNDALTARSLVAGGTVYVAAGRNIDALDEESGRILWSRDYYWSVDHDGADVPPFIVDGIVYFSPGDSIYSHDPATGETVWSFQVDGIIDSPPASAHGLVYIGSDGGQFYATDPSKTNYLPEELVWGFDLVGRTLRHPTVSDGVLYVQSSDGKLQAFNAAKGRLIWTFDLGELTDRKSFTVVEDTVYGGAGDGSVYAIVTEMPDLAEVPPAPEATPVAQETPKPQEAAPEREIPAELGRGFGLYSTVTNDDRAKIDATVGGKDLTLLATWRRPNNVVRWSEDGSRLILLVGPEVYQVAADGSDVQSLVNVSAEMRRTAGPDYQGWAFHAVDVSQDGAYISYSTFEHPERPVEYTLPGAYEYEIGLLEIESGFRRALTVNRAYDDYPAWSPDASKVAFIQWDFDSGYGIRTVDTDSSQETVVVPGYVLPREATNRQTPVWSPDGTRIAFVGYDRNELRGPAIYIVGADGSDLQVVAATNSRPAWSPDGQRIAFAKPDGDELALYTIAADGTDENRITTVDLSVDRASYINSSNSSARTNYGVTVPKPKDTWVDTVAWSPDGSMIMYSCGALICITETDGTHVGTSPVDLPSGLVGAWSSDGSRIAIAARKLQQSFGDGGLALYTMAADGTDVRLLARHFAQGDLHPLGVRPATDPASTAGCAAGIAVANPADNPGLVRDCETLLSIRDILAASPPLDWSGDRPISEWEGVAIDGTPLRVRGLNLEFRGLTGVIPTDLRLLTELAELNLRSNYLSGGLPPQLGDLSRLTSLLLSRNDLTGSIPKEIGNLTNLSLLMLNGTYLHGQIPEEIGQLQQLRILWLGHTLLSGPIPEAMTKLANLQTLVIEYTGLTGEIPRGFGGLANLAALILSRNKLSGEIPSELGQLSNLWKLQLFGNQLIGKIPPELGNLVRMKELYLGDNLLSGPIPAELGNLDQLESLSVSGNKLTGPIPPELGNLSSARALYLSDNRLDGPIPPEIGQLSSLEVLYVEGNQLSGVIPAELGSLSEIWLVSLNDNRLSGPIPPELGQMPALSTLYLQNNELTGSIPAELGQSPRLGILNLSNNELNGVIPADLGDLWNAREIDLRGNQLTGEIPRELGQLSQLLRLSLQDNGLTGEIPPEIGLLFELEELNLSGNQLSGAIPVDLGQLERLNRLDLSGNQLSGTIPPELFRTLLDVVDLSNNRLSGSIPAGIGQHFSLEELDLSGNELTGTIPGDLGNVAYLRLLFLDGNQLSGEIPQEFAGLFRLEEISFSGNQLSGCIPSALRFAVIHELERLGLAYCEN